MTFVSVHRREFITLLGGGAEAWPLAARAQQAALPVIGVLVPGKPDTFLQDLRGFEQGLKEAGLVAGQNVTIDYRYTGPEFNRAASLAADLIQRRVAVIVAASRAIAPAKAATTTIPIVFMSGGDPVAAGFVASLNRPGGNLTGVTLLGPQLTGKRLGLLHDLQPQVTTIGALVDATGLTADGFYTRTQEYEAAARSIGATVRIVRVTDVREFEPALTNLVAQGAGMLIASSGTYLVIFRDQLLSLVAKYRLPAIYQDRHYPDAGGLMSYGPNITEAWRQVGGYTGRVLKGEKPADLPVMLPTRFEFVLNLKTVKDLSLTVPPGVLAIVDEVIE